MNRFIIESSPQKIAKSLCDQHIVKMPLEEAQMLCTTLWHYAPKYAEKNDLYKPVHQKPPCTLWAMENCSNYGFAYRLYVHMLEEYTLRYNKIHGASKHRTAIEKGYQYLPKGGSKTKMPQCFGEKKELKTNEFYPIRAYRAFYLADKVRFARYQHTPQPKWISSFLEGLV